jgi:hypothetical protein
MKTHAPRPLLVLLAILGFGTPLVAEDSAPIAIAEVKHEGPVDF